MKKIVTWNYKILPYLLMCGLLFGLAELFTYPGFIHKHLLISLDQVFYLSIIAGLIFIISGKGESRKNPLYEMLFIGNIGLFAIFLLMDFWLSNLESQMGVNYVFFSFHIQLQDFLPLIMYSLWIIFLRLF